MQQKLNVLAIFASVMTVLFLVAGYSAIFNEKEVVPEGYLSASEVEAQLNDLTTERDSTISSLTKQLEDLTTQLAEKVVIETEEALEEVKESLGYVIDNVFLDVPVVKALSDREVNLFDGEVRFDGTDYDAEEVIELSNMEVLVNEEDFEGTPYLVIPKNSISYKFVFENSLNTSKITDDETLVFNLLGEEVEVSSWNGNEITFSQGEEYMLTYKDVKIIDNKTFVLENVLEDSIYVSVDGVSKKVREGQTRTVNGLEVQVKTVIYSNIGPVLKAVVVLGEEVEKTVVDGDEYAEDSIWDYVITTNSIGIVLNDEFNELDDELKPLAKSEKLCLPNEYVCVRYDGFVETDFEELSFNLEDGFVEIDGNFQVGLNDYDRLLVNSTGIYDEDEEVVGVIKIGSSDVQMIIAGTTITIEDFTLNFDLNVTNVDSKDYSVRTDFGILVENPEDSIEVQSWIISVLESKVESEIVIF